MIEDGAIDRDLSLRDPVRAIKEVSHDPTLQARPRARRTARKLTRGADPDASTSRWRSATSTIAEVPDWAPGTCSRSGQHVLDALERDPMELGGPRSTG